MRMNPRFLVAAGLALWGILISTSMHAEDRRPNILWFVVDDMSANFSCYGEKLVSTPNVDRLASIGTRFSNAHVTAPVCSTCRSALMTGMYQASLGSQNHRMTEPPIQLPAAVQPLPVLFQQAGYYTCNGDGLRDPRGRVRNKTDYNFEFDQSMYDGLDWAGRKPGQPFFMQIQMAGGKLRGASMGSFKSTIRTAKETFGNNVDAAQIELPPYYPNDEVFVQDWAAYLESVRLTDDHVGKILARLEEEGIFDNTLIIFMTDHGISHARGKQFNYREGTHIPFVVAGPLGDGRMVKAGQVREDFIEHIAMAAISLAAAGIEFPDSMQAQNIFADNYPKRDASYAARDRCDETIDFIRSVRTADFLYIRNYNPFRPHLQPSQYKDNKVLLTRLREMRNDGSLNELQMKLLFSHGRAAEELYDVNADRYETRNLAEDPDYANQLGKMRDLLDAQLLSTRDTGFLPEPAIADICARNESVHTFCSSADRYPLDSILGLANRAIRGEPEWLPVLRKEIRNENPIIRYWATLGMRVLGKQAEPARVELESLLKDSDASVRITAAATLANLGSKQEMSRFLVQEAQHATHDAHALWALDAVKYLDMPEAIQGFTSEDLVKGQYSGRTFEYLQHGGLVFGQGVNYWTR